MASDGEDIPQWSCDGHNEIVESNWKTKSEFQMIQTGSDKIHIKKAGI